MLSAALPSLLVANMGPPHDPGRLVGEPNGLESVVITHERLAFDLRPLEFGRAVQVEAVYELENRGDERVAELVFVSGPTAREVAAVTLDDQPVSAVWRQLESAPSSWLAPGTTPAIDGNGTLPYEAEAELNAPHFSIRLTPGTHRLRVCYAARPTAYSTGASPTRYWQITYVLAPAREWGGFGGLDVSVQLPPDWQFAATLSLTRSGDELTATFDELPGNAIAMTAQAPRKPILAGTVFWSTKVLLGICLLCGPIVLWLIGRRIGGFAASVRSVLAALVLSPLAGLAWAVALIACLLLSFQANLLIVDEVQRSQYYGNAYAMFFLGALCILALPAGTLITAASAFRARALQITAGTDAD